MKIMVIGYSGSGKSTLASILSAHYQIPSLHLDKLQFDSNWVERPVNLRNDDLLAFLNSHDTWVIDGNYTGAHFELRAETAMQIFVLDYNRFVCLKNVIKRYFKFRHKTRESVALGCEEKLDKEFILWVIYYGRSKKRAQKYHEIQKQYHHKVLTFKNKRRLMKYLKKEKISVDRSLFTLV